MIRETGRSAMMQVGLFILCSMPVVLLIATLYRAQPHAERIQDTAYARAVFGGLVPYTDVIASGEFAYVGPPLKIYCDYAVVRLATPAPEQPPTRDFSREESARFGGLWQASPGISVLRAPPDALAKCANLLMPSVLLDVQTAMTLPSSWLARDPSGRTFHVYAPGAGMAVRIGIRKSLH
jgi:hypothetical protein